MDQRRIDKIVAALNRKGVNQPCPRCSTNNFSVIGESEILIDQSSRPKGLLAYGLPEITMPTVIVTCDNCGYISQHAQVALGLLPQQGLRGLVEPK